MDMRVTDFATSDAKARFSELLARVEGGETITIRRHGKPVARMVPIKRERSAEDRRQAIEEFLAWRNDHGPRLQPGDNVKDWINEGRR